MDNSGFRTSLLVKSLARLVPQSQQVALLHHVLLLLRYGGRDMVVGVAVHEGTTMNAFACFFQLKLTQRYARMPKERADFLSHLTHGELHGGNPG